MSCNKTCDLCSYRPAHHDRKEPTTGRRQRLCASCAARRDAGRPPAEDSLWWQPAAEIEALTIVRQP